MSAIRASFGLVMLGGCAQLGGIDKTNADNRRVTLAYDRLSVGATEATAPLVLDGLMAEFLVPDDADATQLDPLPADPDTDGLWAAKLGGETTPPVLFTLPDGATYLIALPSRTLHAAFVALEHAAPTPPPTGATVSVTSTLDAPSTAADAFELLEVGAWAQAALTVTPPAATIGPISVPYGLFTNLAAPLPLASVTPDDVFLVMRHAAGVLTGFGEKAPDGPQQVSTTVDIPMAAVAKDQTVAMPVDVAGITARFTGEKPVGGALGMNFNITAAPGGDRGITAGPSLLSGGVTTSIAGSYGNPFAATHMWPAALTFSAAKLRTYAPGGAAGPSITLGTSLNEVIAPDGTTAIAVAAPLPLVITVGISPLAADGASVLIDASKPVPVSFTTDQAVDNTLYQLELDELVASGTTYTRTRRLVLVGDSPSWSLPQGFLLPAHTYLMTASTVSGAFADLTTGDISVLTVPYSTGVQDGGVFTVTL
jgi:hypothetical protein